MAAMTNFRERQSWRMFLLIHLSSGPGSYKSARPFFVSKRTYRACEKLWSLPGTVYVGVWLYHMTRNNIVEYKHNRSVSPPFVHCLPSC